MACPNYNTTKYPPSENKTVSGKGHHPGLGGLEIVDTVSSGNDVCFTYRDSACNIFKYYVPKAVLAKQANTDTPEEFYR